MGRGGWVAGATGNKTNSAQLTELKLVRAGAELGKKKKITMEIVATNVVASRPPNGDRL